MCDVCMNHAGSMTAAEASVLPWQGWSLAPQGQGLQKSAHGLACRGRPSAAWEGRGVAGAARTMLCARQDQSSASRPERTSAALSSAAMAPKCCEHSLHWKKCSTNWLRAGGQPTEGHVRQRSKASGLHCTEKGPCLGPPAIGNNRHRHHRRAFIEVLLYIKGRAGQQEGAGPKLTLHSSHKPRQSMQ
jgi:hypothetical protein